MRPVILAAVWAAATPALAQAPATAPRPPSAQSFQAPALLPYGKPITLEQAKTVAAAAQAEAKRRGLAPATVVIVDPAGELVYVERADTASYSAVDIAVAKARSAARWRRTTRFDSERLAAGVMEVLALPGVMPALGGETIVHKGEIIGGIGETTGKGEDDVARAAAKALDQ